MSVLTYNDISPDAFTFDAPADVLSITFTPANDTDNTYGDGDWLFVCVGADYASEGAAGTITTPGDWVEDGAQTADDSGHLGVTVLNPWRLSTMSHLVWAEDQSTYTAEWDISAITGTTGFTVLGIRVSNIIATPTFTDGGIAPTDAVQDPDDYSWHYGPIPGFNPESYFLLDQGGASPIAGFRGSTLLFNTYELGADDNSTDNKLLIVDFLNTIGSSTGIEGVSPEEASLPWDADLIIADSLFSGRAAYVGGPPTPTPVRASHRVGRHHRLGVS